MLELPGLEPVHCCCVNCNCFLWSYVGSIFEIVVLALLLSLQVQPSQSSEILFSHCFVNCRTPSYPFTIVISSVRPPISLCLDVSDDHVLNWGGKSRNFPRNICFPTPPRFRKMLQDCFGLVCLDTFRHHIVDVYDYTRTKFKIVLALNPLFSHCFGYPFAVTPFELPG